MDRSIVSCFFWLTVYNHTTAAADCTAKLISSCTSNSYWSRPVTLEILDVDWSNIHKWELFELLIQAIHTLCIIQPMISQRWRERKTVKIPTWPVLLSRSLKTENLTKRTRIHLSLRPCSRVHTGPCALLTHLCLGTWRAFCWLLSVCTKVHFCEFVVMKFLLFLRPASWLLPVAGSCFAIICLQVTVLRLILVGLN